ncbi:MAG: YitT family protein [Bacteroidales bacterium]|nr:YitT family protein [Bacteroidales bacterium]MCB9012875.1 YitT family protein [Bacteroidales bacterium]
MAFITKEKLFSPQWFKNYLLIILGSFIMAAGFVYFITPYKIVPGGVFGISIVIHYLTQGMFSWAPEGLPVGAVGLIMNIPLTIIGIKVLGPKFGVKTVMGFILLSIFIDLQTYFWGDRPLVENDPLLSTIFGGVLVGFGLGLVFKSKATSGGSDIIAMIIAKYTRQSLGQLLIYVDSVIVLVGLVAFGDWRIPLYSWITIFISGKVIDATMQGVSYNKALFIISDKYEEIRLKILKDLSRGATAIPVKGMYEGKERNMIFVNLNRREMAILQQFIWEVDKDAFLTVFDAYDVFGEGFKPLQEE